MAVSLRAASPAHFLFKIESFSLLNKCGFDKYETGEFEAGNYKWRLVIYPNGHETVKAGDYVSAYLAISGTDCLPKNWEVNAVFSIFIYNHISDKYVYTPGKTRRFFALQSEWGFSNFMSKKYLTTPSVGYLVDDSCLFGAEVTVEDYRVPTECLSLKNVETPHKHVFKISYISTSKDVWEYSEVFIAGGYKWEIHLYPRGEDNRSDVSINVLCAALNTGDRVMACYTICLKNQLAAGNNRKCTGSDWFDASSPRGQSWSPGMSTAQLYAANGGFILNDTCLIEIELAVQAIVAHDCGYDD